MTVGLVVGFVSGGLGTGSGQFQLDWPGPVWPSGLHEEGGHLLEASSVVGG